MFLMTLSFCLTALGKDLGVMGQSFPVIEESLIDFMQKNMSEKLFSQKKEELKEALFDLASKPSPVEGIGTAHEYRSFLFDPSLRVKEDILNEKGSVIVKAGTLVNPLKKIHLSSSLLFLDGDNAAQIEWARKLEGSFKWILVRGRPIELEAQERRPIYFDQSGTYSRHFQIKNVPARITQQGNVLLVEEIALDAEGVEL